MSTSVSSTSIPYPRTLSTARFEKQISSVAKDKIIGQICEAMTVIIFAGAFATLLLGFSLKVLLLMAFLFFCAAVTFRAALKFSYDTAGKTTEAAGKVRYEVTPLRIKTLLEAKVPADVISCLEDLKFSDQPTTMNREALLEWCNRCLGEERTSEFEALVLKYTRVFEPKAN